MATLHFDGADDWVRGSGQGTTLDGAVTIALLLRRTAGSASYEAFFGGATSGNARSIMFAYDQTASPELLTVYDGTTNSYSTTTTADTNIDWWLLVFTKASGASVGRFHFKDVSTGAAAVHENASVSNSWPSLNGGYLKVGNYDLTPGVPGSAEEDFTGDIALVGWWTVAMTDAQVDALAANGRTSDWWNHSAGQPASLTEMTAAAPTDLAARVAWVTTGATATGASPPWTFDGVGTPGGGGSSGAQVQTYGGASAKTTVIRAQALDGDWEVVGADRALGIWPQNVGYEFDEWGPSRASFEMRRDGSRPWPDIGAFAPVEILVGGAVVWDGRVAETPSRVAQRTMNVQCEGWQYHLDDDVFDSFYVHNDLSAWKDSRSVPVANLTVFRAVGQIQNDSGAISLMWPQGAVVPAGLFTGVVLDLGPGCTASGISIDWDSSNNDASAQLYVRGTNNADVVAGPIYDAAVVTQGGGTTGTARGTFSTPSRYVNIFMYRGTGVTLGAADVWFRVRGARVFANDAWREFDLSILTAPDVVADSLTKGCPLLSTSTQLSPVPATARDRFMQTAGALAGKTLDIGGIWIAGGNSATDFTVNATSHTADRSSTSDVLTQPLAQSGRIALADATNYTAVTVHISMTHNGWGPNPDAVHYGVIARYVDSGNFLFARASPSTSTATTTVSLILGVAGLNVVIATVDVTDLQLGNAPRAIRLSVDSQGVASMWWWDPRNPISNTPILSGTHANLAPGGLCATGRVGFWEYKSVAQALTRQYDGFLVLTPPQTATFTIPTFAPDGPQTARQNWQAVDAYHDWIKKIDLGRVPIYKPRPTAPVIEVGQFSAIDDEDASANSGEDIYNKVIVVGQTPDGRPVRATGTAAASLQGQTIVTATESQQLDVGGAGAAGFNSVFKIYNHVPYLVRILAVTRTGGTGGLPIDVYAGWPDFDSGSPQNTGDMIHFGAVPVPYSGAPISAIWTPTKLPDDAVFGIGVTAPGGGTAGSSCTVIADLVWGGTVVDRRGFAKTKVLPISSALPPDLVAATSIGSTWAASHRTAPFRGSAPVTGDGAVRIIDTGEDVPPERLGQYTGQLVLFNDRSDPDSGGWGRIGRVVGVSVSPGTETATMTIDNTRSSFETLMARFDLLSR